jgi:hypothetical protein
MKCYSVSPRQLEGLTMTTESRAFVPVSIGGPDRFFGAGQLERLAELMAGWRSAQEQGQGPDVDEQTELEALIETELRASAARAAALADEFGSGL